MRDNDLIFTASYTDPDMVYFKAKKQDSENVDFFNAFTQRIFDNPELTQEEVVRQMYPCLLYTSQLLSILTISQVLTQTLLTN